MTKERAVISMMMVNKINEMKVVVVLMKMMKRATHIVYNVSGVVLSASKILSSLIVTTSYEVDISPSSGGR